MTTSALAALLSDVPGLPATPRMPLLFLGHGSPMNVIEDNEYRRAWTELGQRFGKQYPTPRLILCVSAHFLTQGWWLTAMPKPRTIHDFGGFPQELFSQQYPAPGAPEVARALSATISAPALKLDEEHWGLDHGVWGVLKPMFPKADIPVLSLSMDYSRPPVEHFALGQQLAGLRERGVLIIGSGNLVHNLRVARFQGEGKPYDWALEFDQKATALIDQGNLRALADFLNWGPIARQAHPTHDHYLPLLYAAAAARSGEPTQYFSTSFQAASISMRSVIWS